jgi:hypothetical protein
VLVPATGRDQVHRHQIARERPQPRLATVDPPAGLIWRDRGAAADRLDQHPIGRLKPTGLASDRLHHPTWGDADPEPGQRPSGLLRREPQLLVELGRQRDRARAKHAGGRAQRVGGLKRVTTLMPASAAPALADMHSEPATQPPRLGQLVLMLVLGALVLDLPAALAPRRKRRV